MRITNNKKHNYIFKLISECAREIKEKCYLVGGYVRDLLLKRQIKNIDIDISTSTDGSILANKVAKKMNIKTKVIIYKRFRTAMIKYQNIQIEFVCFRKESYNLNSRNPIIVKSSLQEDQKRRDFTINSLAISLNYYNYGKLIDPFNGVLDLKQQIIKTPKNPKQTFLDDPLRMLRAIRFASQLNFNIDKKALKHIFLNRNRIKILPMERIIQEFNKILLTKKPSKGLFLLYTTGILKIILPELTLLKGTKNIKGFSHKDNFIHTIKVVDNISVKTNNLWLIWAALLHDIGKYYTKKFNDKIGWTFHSHEYIGYKMIPDIFKRLKLPTKNNTMKYVQQIIKYSSRPISLINKHATDSAFRRLIFEIGDNLNDLMMLCNADITTKNNDKKKEYKQNFKIVIKKLNEIQEKDKIRNWMCPISGYEIMKIFKIKPCKEIGLIKQSIKQAILEKGAPNNYKSAFMIMMKKGHKLGLKRNK